jgi:hypothetical protein
MGLPALLDTKAAGRSLPTASEVPPSVVSAELSAGQRWGLGAVLYLKLMNGLKRSLGFHLYAIQVGSHDAGSSPALPVGVALRVLTSREINDRIGEAGLDIRSAFVGNALARGDLCVGAFEGDRLVAYSWRALSGPVRHRDGWEVTWRSGLVYRYKSLTLPEYRGLHLDAALSKYIDRYLAQRGYPMGLSFVETINLSSLRSVARKGRRCMGYAGYFDRFGCHIPFWTPGCRTVGFAFQWRQE